MNTDEKRVKILWFLMKKMYHVGEARISIVSVPDIAKKLRFSKSSVYRSLRFLQEQKMIKKYTKNGYKNIYVINMSAIGKIIKGVE